ncbi:hypothetical protein [Chryseolinea sp. H1M3-3]|uniref:hypothetical protein n=1 Tax=Chryseolinea sp. H1M3-3 TaxID=3034144 RepID=UPI0023EB68D6|nr:hypothetical protein [Chryseolinea sp. H1M3-3]
MGNKSQNAISIVTGMLLIYLVAASLPMVFAIVFWLFLLTTAGLIWMVITVLKDTTNLSGRTFDEYFYEDAEYRNNE